MFIHFLNACKVFSENKFMQMKLFVLKKLLKSLGEGVTLKNRIHFETPHLVSIGSYVFINQDVYFGNGFTTVKNHTMIGNHNVKR